MISVYPFLGTRKIRNTLASGFARIIGGGSFYINYTQRQFMGCNYARRCANCARLSLCSQPVCQLDLFGDYPAEVSENLIAMVEANVTEAENTGRFGRSYAKK